VPVRTWAVVPGWRSADGLLTGSHDASGKVRPEYVAEKLPLLYEDGKLNAALLDPDCVEARGWNLSAGQYKPRNAAEEESGASVSSLIDDLRILELDILKRLKRLKKMAEERP
jgi:type I restriction enzyme M protein